MNYNFVNYNYSFSKPNVDHISHIFGVIKKISKIWKPFEKIAQLFSSPLLTSHIQNAFKRLHFWIFEWLG